MRYARRFRITIEGIRCDNVYEFTYQIRQFGESRIPIVTDTHKILDDGKRESAPWFWIFLPIELHDALDAEMIYHHDKAAGGHLAVRKVTMDEAAEALRRVC